MKQVGGAGIRPDAACAASYEPRAMELNLPTCPPDGAWGACSANSYASAPAAIRVRQVQHGPGFPLKPGP
jgi:hypothetical protein